jgi:AraC-like DNA-binding protein
MQFMARPTAAALLPFVDCLWYVDEPDLEPGRELVMPGGAMQLLVNLGEDELRTYSGEQVQQRVAGAAIQGSYAGAVEIDNAQQRAIVGVAFRPGGAFPFTPIPPSAAADSLVALTDVWGRDGAVLRDRLLSARSPAAMLATLEAVLLARAVHPLEPDPATVYALAAFERGRTVSAVAERIGVTPRHFGRRFRDRVGLAPKRFTRIRRFQRLIASLRAERSADWASLAVQFGYHDQAHLIHDFRALSGLSPTEYRPRSTFARNHVALSG